MDIMELKELLKQKLGIKYLFPHQELVIMHIAQSEMNGGKSNILACLPTGSGKSICFMAPTVFISGIIISVYPLLSLMADQEKRMKAMGIESVTLKGGLSREEREERIHSLLSGKAKVLITNMETLLYMSKDKKLTTIWQKTGALVIDEVHIAASWGDTFRPSYRQLPEVVATINPRHLLAFTATMDNKTYKIIKERVFRGVTPYVIKASADRSNIYYHAMRSLNRKEDILSIVRNREYRPCVVFCPRREDTEKLSLFLRSRGIRSTFYHAGLDKEERKRIEDFFNSDSSSVLCATSAYGTGVDKKDIRATIHYRVNMEAEEFLQESGRAGRDGSLAHSFVLYDPLDGDTLLSVFKDQGCIRRKLLSLMDEESDEEGCTQCSHCQKEEWKTSGEKEILTISKRHLIWRRRRLEKRIKRRSLLPFLPSLPGWEEKEISRALDILVEEKLLKEWRSFILLTGKGNKRLSIINSSN